MSACRRDSSNCGINDWVAAGAPQGEPDNLPEAQEFVTGWQIGEPDLIVKMSDQPYHVAAEGEVKYQYFTVDPGFKEDKWISAAECRIGNRAVVHHIIVALHRDGSLAKHGQIDSEWITATAPGAQPLILPDGYAKLIPAGARLVFQMHYTTYGKAMTDRTRIGLYFSDEPPRNYLRNQVILSPRIQIPPHEPAHLETAYVEFYDDAVLH